MPSTHPSNGPQLESISAWLDAVFTYHAPTDEDVEKYATIRLEARNLAETILLLCPACADRSTAIRKVREALMTANVAIALDGK